MGKQAQKQQCPPARKGTSEQTKMMIVAALSVALIVVVYVQFSGSEAEVPSSAPNEETAISETGVAPVAAPTVAWVPKVESTFEVTTLRTRKIEDILKRHPLDVARVVPSPNPMPVPPAEPVLVQAVYLNSRRGAAIIGNRIVRQGEALPNGQKLIAATPSGVVTGSRVSVEAAR